MASLDNHEKCHGAVYIICYKKEKRALTTTQIELIQEHLTDGFDIENQDFPSAICVNCNILLNGKISKRYVVLPTVESYDPERPQPLLCGAKCDCNICKIATASINSKSSGKKRGRPKIMETEQRNKRIFK